MTTEAAHVVEVISNMNEAGSWQAKATLRHFTSSATAAGPCEAAKAATAKVTRKAAAHEQMALGEGVQITHLYAKDEDDDSYAIFADTSDGQRISVGISWVSGEMAERMSRVVEVPLTFC